MGTLLITRGALFGNEPGEADVQEERTLTCLESRAESAIV